MSKRRRTVQCSERTSCVMVLWESVKGTDDALCVHSVGREGATLHQGATSEYLAETEGGARGRGVASNGNGCRRGDEARDCHRGRSMVALRLPPGHLRPSYPSVQSAAGSASRRSAIRSSQWLSASACAEPSRRNRHMHECGRVVDESSRGGRRSSSQAATLSATSSRGPRSMLHIASATAKRWSSGTSGSGSAQSTRTRRPRSSTRCKWTCTSDSHPRSVLFEVSTRAVGKTHAQSSAAPQACALGWLICSVVACAGPFGSDGRR